MDVTQSVIPGTRDGRVLLSKTSRSLAYPPCHGFERTTCYDRGRFPQGDLHLFKRLHPCVKLMLLAKQVTVAKNDGWTRHSPVPLLDIELHISCFHTSEACNANLAVDLIPLTCVSVSSRPSLES